MSALELFFRVLIGSCKVSIKNFTFLEAFVSALCPLKSEALIRVIKNEPSLFIFIADQYKTLQYIEKTKRQRVVACHLVSLSIVKLVNVRR